MSDRWRRVVRESTLPAPGARERVWRSILRRRAPRPARRLLAWAAVGTAALILGVWAWPRSTPTVLRSAGAVVVLEDAEVEGTVEEGLRLRAGRVAISAWGETPVRVRAGHRDIVAQAAVVTIEVAGDRVVVVPLSGTAEVDGELKDATDPYARPSAPAGSLASWAVALEPPRAHERRLGMLAVQAERRPTPVHALAALTALAEVSEPGSLARETALVRRGQLELYRQGDPRRALATFHAVASEFPDGALVQEVELDSLEAEVTLARWEDVRTRARRFLERFPGSERAGEVRAALEQAQRRLVPGD